MSDEPAAIWDFVDELEAELDVLVASVADRVLTRVQAADGQPSTEFHEALRRATSAGARDAFARLRCQAELPEQLLPDLSELARLCATLRFDPTKLTDAWLAGEEVFWDHLHVIAERTLGDTALCWEVLKVARARLRGHSARLSELFRRACERELARVNGIDGNSRLGAVLRVLDGQWVDPGELGYDVAAQHLAWVADAARSLDPVVRGTERQVLQVRAPDGGSWGWLGGRTTISESEIDALIASQRSSGARVAFGEPAEGIAGFAVSHHQALEARAVAGATNQRAVRFADLRLLIAVLRDADLARGFIERELGDLDRPGERMHELRETLRAYLEHSQSVSAAAAVRRRDRKTIERQLRSAEQLIHHRVSDRSDELLVALRVADILQHRA